MPQRGRHGVPDDLALSVEALQTKRRPDSRIALGMPNRAAHPYPVRADPGLVPGPARKRLASLHLHPPHVHRPLAIKSVLVVGLMMAAFFAGQPPPKVALIAGGFMLLTRIVRSERIYREIDWPLLLMFAGLFVVVAGFETALLTPELVAAIGRLGLADAPALSAVTAVLSNLVSNVPAVLVLRPFVGQTGDPQQAWLIVAMASTLAGNLTVLGSVANLIVVQLARAGGVAIGFWEYFRVGAPLTLLTILLGLWWL